MFFINSFCIILSSSLNFPSTYCVQNFISEKTVPLQIAVFWHDVPVFSKLSPSEIDVLMMVSMDISTSSWVLRSVICWVGSAVLEKLDKNVILPKNAGKCSTKYHGIIVCEHNNRSKCPFPMSSWRGAFIFLKFM